MPPKPPKHKTPKPPKAHRPPKPKGWAPRKANAHWWALGIVTCVICVTLGVGYGLLGWGGAATPPVTASVARHESDGVDPRGDRQDTGAGRNGNGFLHLCNRCEQRD